MGTHDPLRTHDAPNPVEASRAVVAHRLLNDITVMVSGLRTLAELEAGTLSPRALDIIDRSVAHGEAAVEALRTMMTAD